MDNKLIIDQISLSNKKIVMRVDFNVPLSPTGEITNTQRIDAALPTINYALNKNCKSVVLMSHLGRPKGKYNKKFSLQVVHTYLENTLKRKIIFLEKINYYIIDLCKNVSHGSIILLENLRFYPEETNPEINNSFSNILSKLGDIYVNDAFGTCHRSHTSIVGINTNLKVGGFLIKKEISYFSQVLDKPKRPFLSILGGAKVSDKIKLIDNLLDKVNLMIIGGGMAFTFLHTLNNMAIGSSLFDAEGATIVKKIMAKAKKNKVEIYLPCDFVIADSFNDKANINCVTLEQGIPENWMGLDIGPKTTTNFCNIISKSQMIVWNGPMGVCEMKPFANGTKGLLQACVEVKKNNAITVIGGGDTATAVKNYSSESNFSHVSTGGGASLELLEGKILPGIAVLSNYSKF